MTKISSNKRRKTSAAAKVRHIKILKAVQAGKTLKDAAIEAGLSESYAKAGKLTKSLTWQELLEKHLPDDKISAVMEEGLEAVKFERVGKKFEPLPDYGVRHKYAETSLKLKGKLIERSQQQHSFALEEMSDAELDRLLAEQQKFFKKQ